jgi:oligopeptide/dipeptide ABC transporter ATP-binding protein
LLASVPRLEIMTGQETTIPERLTEIEGMVPALYDLPIGCAFAPRCPMAIDKCRVEEPGYEEVQPNHWVACWRADDAPSKGEDGGSND